MRWVGLEQSDMGWGGMECDGVGWNRVGQGRVVMAC